MPKHNRSSGSSVRQSKMRKEEDSLCHQCTPIDGDMGNDIKSSTDDLQINATCNSYFEDNGLKYQHNSITIPTINEYKFFTFFLFFSFLKPLILHVLFFLFP